MRLDFLLAAAGGGGLADTAGQVAEQFGLDWPHFIAQCVSFLIVAAVLYKFAYQPVLKVLEERRQRIAQGLADADRIKQELANAQSKAEAILSQANAQGAKLIEEVRVAAAKLQEQESQKAIAAAAE